MNLTSSKKSSGKWHIFLIKPYFNSKPFQQTYENKKPPYFLLYFLCSFICTVAPHRRDLWGSYWFDFFCNYSGLGFFWRGFGLFHNPRDVSATVVAG